VTVAAHADSFDKCLENIYQYYNLIEARPDLTLQIESVNDILRAKEENKIGIMFGLQSPTPVDKSFYRWSILSRLGVKLAQLTYMERTIFGDGCKEPENRGLTYFGIQAVREMNRLGIVVDLSHLGERTSLDATEVSEKPVIYSHSNPKAIGPSQRNITDEQIKKCAETGGVVGLCPHSEMSHKVPGQRPTVEDFLDHIDYVAQLVGPEHVGIGTDIYESYTKVYWEAKTKRLYKSVWFYETMLPDGLSKVTELPNVTRGLVQRGYSDEEIKGILGMNWLKVFRQIWTSND
jgi:membrane dipeptidase